MTCFYCKGDMQQGTTTHMEERGNRISVVKHVPCLVCGQCGEVAYAAEIVRWLEKTLDSLKEAAPEITVLNYQDKAA